MKKSILPLAALTATLFSCSEKSAEKTTEISYPEIAPFNPPTYVCYQADKDIKVDGKLDEWDAIPWSSDFTDIEGDKRPAPHFKTNAKMAYDEKGMYFAALLEEPHVWSYQTEHDCVIFNENDFEIFLDPTGDTHNYLEYEVNALGTLWDLYLSQPYRDRPAVLNGWEFNGMLSAVHVDGTVNNPNDTDKSWSVEVFIPWSSLNQVMNKKGMPEAGDQFRVNFSRVQWTTEVQDGKYVKIPIKGEDKIREYNWVWAPTGVINIHMPEYWGYVQFAGVKAGTENVEFTAKAEEKTKWTLRQLYYRQRIHREKENSFAGNASSLKAEDICSAEELKNLNIYTTPSLYEITLPDTNGKLWHINQDGLVW